MPAASTSAMHTQGKRTAREKEDFRFLLPFPCASSLLLSALSASFALSSSFSSACLSLLQSCTHRYRKARAGKARRKTAISERRRNPRRIRSAGAAQVFGVSCVLVRIQMAAAARSMPQVTEYCTKTRWYRSSAAKKRTVRRDAAAPAAATRFLPSYRPVQRAERRTAPA